MSFSYPIQWYHSHVDPILPDGTFKHLISISETVFQGYEGSAAIFLQAQRLYCVLCKLYATAISKMFHFILENNNADPQVRDRVLWSIQLCTLLVVKFYVKLYFIEQKCVKKTIKREIFLCTLFNTASSGCWDRTQGCCEFDICSQHFAYD